MITELLAHRRAMAKVATLVAAQPVALVLVVPGVAGLACGSPSTR